MVEAIGICEKHQLPLDRNGECELCRLSDMPSKAPPAGSAWWALIIPLVLAVACIAWAFSSFVSEPQSAPPRGVRNAAPPAESPAATEPRDETPEPEAEPEPEPEPSDVPEPPRPPVPGDDIPVPEPSPEGTQLDEAPYRGVDPAERDVPEWKWSLARRRVNITMYATQWCSVCREAREYMETNRIDFIELDTEANLAAGERLGDLNPGRTIPTFAIDGQVYIGFREDAFEGKINQAARKHL
jgi:glutaredoxin